MIDLTALDPDQRRAVTHGEGPLLVISAAGSGKTRTLTHRAAWLVDEGARPSDITLSTFTRKAAAEMVERVGALIGPKADLIRAGTMHSLFLKVLRGEAWPWASFDILDEYQQKRLLRDNGLDKSTDIGEVIAGISLAKNELLTPAAIRDDDPSLAGVWADYEATKREREVIDFDDMLVETVRLFEAKPEALERHRPAWLLVDEAQDTSTAQWRALELLAGTEPRQVPPDGAGPGTVAGRDIGCWTAGGAPSVPARNITCVADWRQAIYSWRGARPEAILDFEQRFLGAVVVSLPTNYRSTPPVVTAANDLIRHAGRALEDMRPHREGGVEVNMAFATDPDIEAEDIADRILAATVDGRNPGEFACLYRTNAYSRALEEQLASRGIPYVVIGSKGFFGRREVADMLAYLRLATDPNDEDALRRIINRPTRFLGKAFVDSVAYEARERSTSLIAALKYGKASYRQQGSADRLASLLDTLRAAEPAPAIQTIRWTGYDDWLLREEGAGTADEDRIENLDELERVAARYSTTADLLRFADMQLSRSQANTTTDRVNLLTIHRAKGLEWPVVFACGWSEGILPHGRCMDGAALEEERRLGYVAVTRARDELFVSSVRWWREAPVDPSRFVYEAGLAPEPAVIPRAAVVA